MNTYHDKYGRIHNKPVTESNPYPCNNAWLYTAYYQKSGVPFLTFYTLTECWIDCNDTGILQRNPDQDTPPISRDEILGLVYLKVMNTELEERNWEFSPYYVPRFNLFKLVSQLWELRPRYELLPWDGDVTNSQKEGWVFKHRNYFWENKLDQIYRFAFSVPIQDRYFILGSRFKWYKPSHLFYKAVAYIDSKGSPSGLKYLKYGGEANKKAMLEEFPEDHPIRKA